jgi:hypothetical protein
MLPGSNIGFFYLEQLIIFMISWETIAAKILDVGLLASVGQLQNQM